MAVDPAQMAATLGGEPASEEGTPTWLAEDMERLAAAATQEANDAQDDSDDYGVLSPSGEAPSTPSGEPATSQGDAVPSPDDGTDPELSAALERRQGESRAQHAQRIQAFITDRETKAREALTAAEQAQQRTRDQVAALQAQYNEANEWLGPRQGTPEWDALEEKALAGDWQARDQLTTYKERQKFEGVLRLSGFAQLATDLEAIAEAEGLSVDEFRQSHGNKMGTAVGLIIQSAVAKATGPKDAEIAKLKSDLANEKTAHATLREKSQATGLQPVSGGSPGGGGPLGDMMDSKGYVTNDAIEAALEGRFRGLDLSQQ